MSRTHCDHCNALVTPGASFCLKCFLPFEDEPAPAVVEAPVPAAVGAPADGFFAPPPAQPAFASHPGQGVDWRATAPAAAMLGSPPRPARSKVPMVAGCVVALLALAGAYLGARALFAKPSDKASFATAFREGRPPEFLPAFPDLGTFRDPGNPEGPGDARAFVESVDARIRAGNAALLTMQGTLDRWADGTASDDDVRAGITELYAAFDTLGANELLFEAPGSTQRGLSKLNDATIGYRLSLGALLDWMDTGAGGSKLTYRLSVGTANVDWDTGIVNLYRAAGLEAPPLPHPQPED